MIIQYQLGDCVTLMQELPDESVGVVVCDPPYGLGFLNQEWDHFRDGTQGWHSQWLGEAFRVLQPGGLIKVFTAPKLMHHLIVAMSFQSFEILHVEAWLYGSGFPKSLSVSKAVDSEVLTGKSNSVALAVSEKTRPVVGHNRRVISAGRTKENEGLHGGAAYWERWNNYHQGDVPVTVARSDIARTFDGYGTSLRPAWESLVVARRQACL